MCYLLTSRTGQRGCRYELSKAHHYISGISRASPEQCGTLFRRNGFRKAGGLGSLVAMLPGYVMYQEHFAAGSYCSRALYKAYSPF